MFVQPWLGRFVCQIFLLLELLKIFGGNEKKHTLVIFNTKDSKDSAINNNAIEFEEYEKGKWRTVLKNMGNTNAGEQPDEVPADVPEKVKQ